MPYPYREMSGFGADATDTATATAANKTSGLMLIGLGALVIVGGIIAFGPKKMHANASRRKKRRSKRRATKKRTGRAYHRSPADKVYVAEARDIRHDIDDGKLTTLAGIERALRTLYAKHKGEYHRKGITSAKQFVKGVKAEI
jgi:ribosomal protein L19E